uniref:Caprin-1 dimerization domain-containing protein n=1 Tax=Ascaris lumbricoides TaxID=6252 RepID=A0A9J2P5X6_ASCLU
MIHIIKVALGKNLMFEMVSRNTAKKLNGGSGEITKPPRIVQENNNVLDRRSEDEAILSNPMLKVEVVFAKRIRNLEKRKQKLLQYGEQQKNGKPLERDQMEAYSRLDEVSKQLEFLYEMRTVVEENAKCYQQALEKNREITIKERAEAEREKLSTLIRYQELSNVLGNSLVRKAFLDGSAGGAQLSEQELNLMDTLYAVLNPSLESVRDVGEWAEKTDKYAHIVSEILNASEEVVIMQHSGNDIKNLLEKVSKFDLANILKLLEEGRRKESVRDERNVLDAMNQTEADKTVPVAEENDVDECDVTVTSSVSGSNRSQMPNDPVTAEHCPVDRSAKSAREGEECVRYAQRQQSTSTSESLTVRIHCLIWSMAHTNGTAVATRGMKGILEDFMGIVSLIILATRLVAMTAAIFAASVEVLRVTFLTAVFITDITQQRHLIHLQENSGDEPRK